MNHRINFLRASFGLLFFFVFATGVFAQVRVNKYIITTPTLTWNDLSTNGGSLIYNGIFRFNSGSIGITLPIAFNYDNTAIAANSTLYMSGSSISFGTNINTNSVTQGGLGSSTYPGMLVPYGGTRTCCGGEFWSNNGIYTQLSGVAPNRVFTIQMNNVHGPCAPRSNGSADGCSIQVKFFETTNIIQFIYHSHSVDLSLECGSYYYGFIGLNGFNSPSFLSVNETTSGIGNAPSTDYQFSPVPPAEFSLQPKTLNFGTATPQNPITMSTTAKSVGASGTTLHILGYTLTGSSAFTLVNPPAIGTALATGSSTQFSIKFLPFSNGVITGTLTVQTDGVDSGTQTVALNGVGAVPLVSYSANTMFRGVDVEVTKSSSPQYLYVNSIGGGPLTINSAYFIGLNASAYTITHLPAGPIPSGGVDSIGIVFSPTIQGIPDAHLVVNTTAVNIPSDTVLMFGVGILPHLTLTSSNAVTQYPNPLKVSFDSVKLGTDSCISITLTNPGSDTLAIENNYFASSDVDFSFTPLTAPDTLILPGGSQSIQVCFDPVQRGYRTATLRIVTNIPHTETNPQRDTSEFDVVIEGTGVPSGILSITGPSSNGIVAVGQSGCVTDTFWNNGPAPITVTGATISGTNASVFNGSYPAFPFVLQGNASQTFTLCATPGDTGTQTGILTGTATSGEKAESATLNLSVYGTSVADTIAVTTPFEVLTCMPGSDTATITVTNQGNIPTPYNVGVSGANSSDFTIIPPTTSPTESAGGVATFQVVYNPSAPGASNASFNVTGGNGGSVALNATGGAAVIAGSGTAPLTTVGFTSNFSAAVTNTGTCDWTPGTVTVTAPFAYVSGGNTVIPAGGNGTLNFSYTPTTAGPATQQTVGFSNSTGMSVPAANVVINGSATTEGVKTVSEASGYSLDQNYPNPFNDKSNLEITLPAGGLVQLSIMDVQGNTVENVLNQRFDAGTYSVSVNSAGLASGTYYYQMVAGGVTLTRQMTIVK